MSSRNWTEEASAAVEQLSLFKPDVRLRDYQFAVLMDKFEAVRSLSLCACNSLSEVRCLHAT